MAIDFESSNEDVLREGECPTSNCLEVAGHFGVHSYELARQMRTLSEGLREVEEHGGVVIQPLPIEGPPDCEPSE